MWNIKMDNKLLRMCELVYSTGKWTRYPLIESVDAKYAEILENLIKTHNYVWIPANTTTDVFGYMRYEKHIDVTINDIRRLLFSLADLKLWNFQEKPRFLTTKPLLSDNSKLRILANKSSDIMVKLDNKHFIVWVGVTYVKH